jgi:peptide/nickel transport system substrate-binding protein
MLGKVSRKFKLAAAAAIVTFSGLGASAEPKGDLVVLLGTLGAENYLQPLSGVPELNATFPMYETLLYSSAETGLPIKEEGRLAETWEVSSDYQTYTFRLRKDVPFHKGNGVVTSADVKFAFELSTRPDTKSSFAAQLRTNVESVETPDEHTVIFRMKRPWRDFAGAVTERRGALAITSKAYVERVGEATAAREPIGTGPFQFKGSQLGESVTFEAVKDHWRKEPRLATVTIRAVPEPSTALALLRTGAAHLTTISFDQLAEAESAGLKIITVERQNQTSVHLLGQFLKPAYDPADTPPWAQADKDKALKVRQALSLAINREEIAQYVLQGRGSAEKVCVSGFFPNNPGFDSACESDPYDPERALELLAEAGYASPEDLKFTVSLAPHPNRPFNAMILEAVAQQWANIGLGVTVEKTTWANHEEASGSRKATFAASYAAPYFDDPAALLNVYSTSVGRNSFTGESEETDRLLPAAIGAVSDADYVATRKALFDWLRQGTFSIPVVYGDLLFGLNPKLEITLHPGTVGYHNYELMGFTD